MENKKINGFFTGICILILLQKFFDDVEDESKTI